MKKILYILIGCISLGLGIIGVILPILPTVPFVLLAAFCFARSSERLDGWFKNTKLYRENNMKNGMTKQAKIRIMCSVTLLMSVGFIMMGLRSFPNKRILRNNLCLPACKLLYLDKREKNFLLTDIISDIIIVRN